jgi:hypothetical protein
MSETAEMEILLREREQLMMQKIEKLKKMVEMDPDNLEVIKLLQDALKAQKEEKERQLNELMKKEKANSGKKRNRKSNENDDFDLSKIKFTSPYAKPNLPTETSYSVNTTPSKALSFDEKQFEDLRKEHKRSRKLVKEQFKEFEIFNRRTLERVDYLQQNINAIMEHMGIKPHGTESETAANNNTITNTSESVEVASTNTENSGILFTATKTVTTTTTEGVTKSETAMEIVVTNAAASNAMEEV